MNPNLAWEILGIAPTGDSRAIKRAYARQLKEDRAHKDTERFVALRAAYEIALKLAEENPASTTDVPSADPQTTDTSTQANLTHEECDENQTQPSPAPDESAPSPHQHTYAEVDSERQPRQRSEVIFRPRVIPEDVSDTRWAARRHRRPAEEIPREQEPSRQHIHRLPRENAEEPERKPGPRRETVFRPQTNPDAEPDGQRSPRTFSRRTRAERSDDMPPARPVIPTTDDAPDIDRRPRPRRSDNLQPAARDLAFEITVSELERLLNDPDDSELMALGRNIITHISGADFKQREDIEAWLVRVLAQYRPGRPAFYKLLDTEFGWSEDSVRFQQRFPAYADSILEQIPSSVSAPETEYAEQLLAQQQERRRLIAILNGSFFRWLFVIMFGVNDRPALEALLGSSDSLAEVRPERRTFWRQTLAVFPCMSGRLYLWMTFYSFFVVARIPLINSSGLPLICAPFVPFAIWGCILLPWRHARAEHSPFSRHWPVLALLAVLIPGIWHAVCETAETLKPITQIIPEKILLPIASLIPAAIVYALFRYYTTLRQLFATPVWGKALPLCGLIVCSALLYALPTADELALAGKPVLTIFSLMLVFSCLRQWRWRKATTAGVLLLPFLMVCGGLSIAWSEEDSNIAIGMCAVIVSLIWVAESSLTSAIHPSPTRPLKKAVFLIIAVAFAVILSPLPATVCHAVGFATLLGSEYVAPLFSMRLPTLGRKQWEIPIPACVVILIAVQCLSMFALTSLFPNHLNTSDYATATFAAMLLARLIWTALSAHNPAETRGRNPA